VDAVGQPTRPWDLAAWQPGTGIVLHTRGTYLSAALQRLLRAWQSGELPLEDADGKPISVGASGRLIPDPKREGDPIAAELQDLPSGERYANPRTPPPPAAAPAQQPLPKKQTKIDLARDWMKDTYPQGIPHSDKQLARKFKKDRGTEISARTFQRARKPPEAG
jgi:hypothetical protein